jgi:hypothetical protein
MQQVLTYTLLILALTFLAFKFLKPLKKKKTGDKHCDHCD